ncbi:hypothetical protein O181_119827 [Austropuccinia psidii MF-1]|uniref:Uncharacterized protein n=1 Tax=Austropuccinia psidii MF-1 TaxID=1389203 RepID=A0A9Q3KI19_9BASI|nr:hypothetical protein [Austropuccinia psidii MF-1]
MIYDDSLKPIGKIKKLKFTTGNEDKTYLDFLVFENFNQIIVEENSSIFPSSKESIPPQTDIKFEGEDPEEDELEVEDGEAIEEKEELKKMRRNLDMAIEDPEIWLALDLSCMNEEDEGESPQKVLKMDLSPPEANSLGIKEDYFKLLQEESGYISDTEKDLVSEEPKENVKISLEKRKFEELEHKSARITEYKIAKVWDKDLQKGIKQRMEIVAEGKLVQSEDDLKLYQQNNGYLEDKYKKGRIFKDLEEGELSENTQRIAGLSIIEEFNDNYDQICCTLSSIDLFNQNQEIKSG